MKRRTMFRSQLGRPAGDSALARAVGGLDGGLGGRTAVSARSGIVQGWGLDVGTVWHSDHQGYLVMIDDEGGYVDQVSLAHALHEAGLLALP